MRLICVLFFFVITFNPIFSQEEWGLEKCIFRALEKSLTMEEMEYALQNSSFDVMGAKASRHPNVNGNASMGLNFGRTIDPTTNTFITKSFLSNNYSLSSGITLFNAGAITNSIKQSQLFYSASEADIEQTKRDLALQVSLLYLNVVFAEENLELAKNQKSLTENELDQIDKLIKSGSRPANDRLQLEAQSANNEQNIVIAQNSYDLNILQLKQLLRIPVDRDIVLLRPQNIEVTEDPDLLTFDEVYKEALNNYPAIKASNIRYQASELAIDIAKSALYPTINAQASIGTNYSNQGKFVDGFVTSRDEQEVFINNQSVIFGIDIDEPILSNTPYFDQVSENVSYGVGVGVNIPIYRNKTAKINVERAKLNQMSSQVGIERLKDNLKVTIQQALIDARSAKRKLASTRSSMKAQKAAFENTKKRVELGAASTFELASQQAQLESIQINELIDKFNYLFNIKVIEFYLGKPIKF